jgi:hypothetical protein
MAVGRPVSGDLPVRGQNGGGRQSQAQPQIEVVDVIELDAGPHDHRGVAGRPVDRGADSGRHGGEIVVRQSVGAQLHPTRALVPAGDTTSAW